MARAAASDGGTLKAHIDNNTMPDYTMVVDALDPPTSMCSTWEMGIELVPHVGPLAAAVERVGTFYYTLTQKREILGTPGLQHVADEARKGDRKCSNEVVASCDMRQGPHRCTLDCYVGRALQSAQNC